jgi:hypothetical protein
MQPIIFSKKEFKGYIGAARYVEKCAAIINIQMRQETMEK